MTGFGFGWGSRRLRGMVTPADPTVLTTERAYLRHYLADKGAVW